MPYSAQAVINAKAYMVDVRLKTVCSKCAKQPIEFHHESHETNPNRRVAHLVALGFPISVIQTEIDKCEALCRSCHMKNDGRLIALQAARPNQKGITLVGLLPCRICGNPAKPLRKGICNRCNHRKRPSMKAGF